MNNSSFKTLEKLDELWGMSNHMLASLDILHSKFDWMKEKAPINNVTLLLV